MLGMDRWELVGVYDNEAFIFKRPMEKNVGTFKEPSTDWEPQMPVIDFTKRDDERAFSMWLLNDPHALGLEKLRSAYAAGLAEGRSRP